MSESGQPTGSAKKTALSLAIGFAVAFAIALVVGAFFREPLQAVGVYCVSTFGLPGLTAAVFLIDAIPTPLSYVPFMLLALEGGLDFTAVLMASAGASYAAGLFGYATGRLVGMPDRVARWMAQKHPQARELISRHGAWGIALVGILLVLLVLGTLTGGALGVRAHLAAAALLVRLPKTFLYLLMLESGLSMGAG
jgi:hypothetical protein